MAKTSEHLNVVRDLLSDATDMSQREGDWVTVAEANSMASEYDLDSVTKADLDELVRRELADKKGTNLYRIKQAAGAGWGSEEGETKGREPEDGYQPPGGDRGDQEPRGKTPEDSGDTFFAVGAAGGGTGSVAAGVTRGVVEQIM